MERTENRGAVRIDRLWYDGLAAAVAAAKDGDTLVLCRDVEVDGTLVLDKAITLTTDGLQERVISAAEGGGALMRVTAACAVRGTQISPLAIDGCGKSRNGALLHLQGAGSVFDYVTIRNNRNTGFGGGIYAANGSNTRMEHCTISHNGASVGGAGFVEAGAELYLHRCAVTGNRADTVGGAFRVEGMMLPTGCCVEENTAADPQGEGRLICRLPPFAGTFRGCGDGDGAETAVWQTTPQGDSYESYVQKLLRAGFSQAWENRIDGNSFAAFGREDLSVMLMDTPGLQGGTLRITAEEGELTQLNCAPGAAVTEPLAVMLGVGCPTMQNGAGLLFRLPDGRFIVIDGGYTDDAQQLYVTMRQLAQGREIRIAAWLLTHAHSDHLEAFLAFWRQEEARGVTLERLVINLPGDEVFAQNMVGGPAALHWKEDIRACLTGISPAPQVIRAHPGQVMRLGDAVVTMLYTAELMMPQEVWSFNDTSLICSLRLGGTDFLLLGDCAVAGGKVLTALYSEALRCHVLQASHHGHYNNAPLPALYEKTGASDTLWCSTRERYLWSENRNAAANRWLFQQEWQGKMTIWCAADMVRTFAVADGRLRPLAVEGRVRDQKERGEQTMDIKLVGLDLDGTLLDDDRKVRRRTLEALRLAAERGINLAIISGRNFQAVPEEIRTLPFIRYFVLCNGAGIYDKWNDKLLFQADIPLDAALELYDALDEEDVYYDCYLSDGAWTPRSHYDRIDEFVPVESHRAFLKVNRQPLPDFRAALRQRGKSVWKVQSIYKDTATRDREMERLAEKFPQYTFVTAYSYNLEVNMPAATKGQGLMQLAQILGLDRSQVMAFGDGGNDVTMLQSAGVGVAMGNACDEAKAAAACVGPTNNEDGVAQVLEALVCGEEQVRSVCAFR